MKKAFFLTLICLCITVLIIFINTLNLNQKREGNLVFADIKDIYEIDKIQIKNTDLNLNISKSEKGFWIIDEKDNYFANHLLLSELFDTLKSARIGEEFNNSNIKGFDITFINKEGKTIFSAVLDDQQQSIHFKGDTTSYKTIDIMSLPKEVFYWLEQPLMEQDIKQIEKIEIDNQIIPLEELHPLWPQIMAYTYCEDVIADNKFNINNFSMKKYIKITNQDGVVFDLKLYSDTNEYWVKQKIYSTKLPTSAGNDYINNKAFLYDGWYFKIPAEFGQTYFQDPHK